MKNSQEEIARNIAEKAHDGQFDKGGAPYIEHPAHVASMVEGDTCKAIAWLHDVVEDTPTTFEELEKQGIKSEVIEALRLLTHEKGVPYFDYIKSIKTNPNAVKVKLADLRHNSDLSRLKVVTDKDRARRDKYQEAIDLLNC